ncbi:MAG: [FeFe] hydrogenase H-cluster radical SAM maturase HydE [Phycisphaerae bacterium]|nr:[FeFe] hydrogenase H-cluster radical SAM maturase HydE [Phycisphaerae bacterium]
MNRNQIQSVIERVYAADEPGIDDLLFLLELKKPRDIQTLCGFADRVRKNFAGDEILLRGIIEFSSYCRNTCNYCGLNKNNKQLERYRLSREQILDCVKTLTNTGIKTVVLQSGEDDQLDANELAELITDIKNRYDIAVTLSVGECSRAAYELWKQAGADRYLLKIETSNWLLYRKLHPGMSHENRLRCLLDLKELGYQTGCGCIVGLPGQSTKDLAEDILFFKRLSFDMLGIGPLLPHQNTPLANQPHGDIELTLKTLAVTRIVTKRAHLPANTALQTAGGEAALRRALCSGANVVMPNFTEPSLKKLYEIYPNKICIFESPQQVIVNINSIAINIGRVVQLSRGDAVKTKEPAAILA